MSSLVVEHLQAGYGRISIVTDVSFRVSSGEFVAIVGRNGAGKTTSLAAVSGLRYGAPGGSVVVNDKDISTASPLNIVRSGVMLVREGRRVFRDMSVHENLVLGGYTRRRHGRKALNPDLDRILGLFPALKTYSKKMVGELSGGQQQMVAVGQALMSRPSFLMLDEPASGLAPALVDEMYEALTTLTKDGLGIVVVDQSIERILEWSSRYYVFENGRTALEGESTTSAVSRINDIVLGITTQSDGVVEESPNPGVAIAK
jgi:branched-chain amino acid transport system ATP-binding protein